MAVAATVSPYKEGIYIDIQYIYKDFYMKDDLVFLVHVHIGIYLKGVKVH